MLTEGQHFTCNQEGGVFFCAGQTPDVQQIYAQLQDHLTKLGAQIPAVDGFIAPSTGIATSTILARLHQTVPLPEMLMPIAFGADAQNTIKLSAAYAQEIQIYAGHVLQRFPQALHQPTPPPPAPLAGPAIFSVRNMLIAGTSVGFLAGISALIYRAGKKSAGTVDGRHFLPPDQDEGDDDDGDGDDDGDDEHEAE